MRLQFPIIFYVFLELGMILTYPLAWIITWFYSSRQDVQEQKGTIVIVERWFGKNVFHSYWVQFLRKEGYNVHLVSLPLYKGSFEDSVQELHSYIWDHNLHDITLVGISTGGITAYLYLQQFGGWKSTSQFISIGTPFAGTYAYLPISFLKSCRLMLPGTPFVKSLVTNPVMHPENIVCIRAAFDQLIPADSQILPTTREEVIPVWGHNNLHLYSRKTYQLLLQLISNPS